MGSGLDAIELAVIRHALTHRSKFKVTWLSDALPAWVCACRYDCLGFLVP